MTIQSLEEYGLQASRTCPDLGSQSLNVLHMDIGLYTEIGELLDIFKKHIAYGKELDIVHIGEEIADCEWYNSNKLQIQNRKRLISAQTFKFHSIESICLTLMQLKISEEYASVLTNVFIGIAEYFNLDYRRLLDNNIAKLKIRYPEKFTQENAVNRDLVSERKELEK